MSEREIAYRKYKREYIPTTMASDDTCYLLTLTGDQIEILSNILNYAHDRKTWNDGIVDSERYYMPSDEDFDVLQEIVDDLEFRLMSKCDYVTLDDANERLGIGNDAPEATLDVQGDPIAILRDGDGNEHFSLSEQEALLDVGDAAQVNAPTITLNANTIELQIADDPVLRVVYVSETVNQVQVDGLTFPATQSPAADANTLDDYEEGTCVVGLSALTSGTITLKAALKTLAYTKIGRQVTVTGLIQVDSVSSPVGALRLTGLPFTAGATSDFYSASAIYCWGLAATAITVVLGRVNAGASTMDIYRYATGNVSAMAGDIQANTTLVFGVSYFVA